LIYRALENQLAAAESVLEVPREPDEAVVAYISRLLNAVDRLRGERDQLRRNVSFLEIEARFTAEALEAQRARAKHIAKDSQITSLGRVATVFALVISHIQSTSQPLDGDAISLQTQLKEAINLCAHKDDTIAQTNKKLSELEACMNVMALDLQAADAQRTNIFSQVRILEGKESERVVEVAQAENANQLELQQAQLQLVNVSKTLEETEGQRDNLTLQLTNTQSELTAAQQHLADAQVRYSSLQSHQLASLSSNEATKVLRSQIEELEMRVLRRTEQIGIHQHDIKRLETNLKLSEERVGELMAEVEVLGAEKAAMVEDCADAREARDETIERVEGLEMEVETLEGRIRHIEMARAAEVEALVRIIVEAIGRSRVESMNAARNEKDARQAQDDHGRAMDDLKCLADKYQHMVQRLEEKEQVALRSADRTAELEGKLQHLRQVNEAMLVDHEQAIAVLVRSREELEERLVKSERLHAEGDPGNDLKSLRSDHTDEMRDLQMRLDGTLRELEAARALHVEAEVARKEANVAHEELVRAHKDLEHRADEATERSIAAHGMLAEAVSKHESEFNSLQRELDESVHQVHQLQQKLHEVASTRVQEEALQTGRSQRAESMMAELQQQIANSQKQLDTLQAEKTSNQTEITNLEAEIQRLLSSERYLGDQVQSR
jgi:chromosome segregation ATPase